MDPGAGVGYGLRMPVNAEAPARSPLGAALRSPSTWIVVAGLVMLLVVSRSLLVSEAPPPPAYFTLPEFTLVSHEGRPFGTKELEGKAWVAGFFFTRCPTICPVLLQRQQVIQGRVAGLRPDVEIVSISIDPANDTPEAMRAHAAARGLRLEGWTLLTGETAAIQQLVRDGFKEHLASGPDVAPADVVHSVRFFLVDGQRRVRGLYDGLDEAQIDRLVADTRRVLETADAPLPE